MRTPIMALATVLAISSHLSAQFNSGDIYVTTCDRPDPILKIDPVTFNVTTFVVPTLGCSSPLLFIDSEQLLATDFDSSTVISYDSAGNPTTILGPGDGVFNPWAAGGLQEDSLGNIYVNNWGDHKILKFDSNFQNGTVFADAGDGLNNVDGLEIDANDNFFCGSRNMGTLVLKIDPAGNASTFDNLPTGESVRGISVRKNGDLYVATGVGNIYRYRGGSAAGRVLLTSLGGGSFVGTAFSPDSSVLYATALDSGELYTVDPDTGSTTKVISGGLGQVYGIEVFDCSAGWNNYGTGVTGTFGVPSLTMSADPVLGTTVNLDVGNSLGAATTGVLFFGLAPANVPGFWGGNLLVSPTTVVPVPLPAVGLSLPLVLPDDDSLCDLSLYFQVLESDAGAVIGVSSTPGLRGILGR